MTGKNECGAFFKKEIESGKSFLNPGVIRNLGTVGGGFERDIEVDPKKNLLAFGLKALNGKF